MNFNILRATTYVSKWEDREGVLTLNFEISPEGGAYLDIGDDYILCARSYRPLRDQKRQAVEAELQITTKTECLSHVGGDKEMCGYAQFHPTRKRGRDFDADDAANLTILVVVEPQIFEEMLCLRIGAAGAAMIYLSIDGLDFGWEPDGSHQVWDLKDDTDCGEARRRRITNFTYSVPTFQTTEGEISKAEDRRTRAYLAESPDPEQRKLAVDDPLLERADRVRDLLRQCRTLLLAILAIGLLILWKLGR